jgi:hypothetical protein
VYVGSILSKYVFVHVNADPLDIYRVCNEYRVTLDAQYVWQRRATRVKTDTGIRVRVSRVCALPPGSYCECHCTTRAEQRALDSNVGVHSQMPSAEAKSIAATLEHASMIALANTATLCSSPSAVSNAHAQS